MRKPIAILLVIAPRLLAPALFAQDRKVERTWLYRDVVALQEHSIDLTTSSCHYTAIFGEGDSEAKLPQSVARFGQLTVDGHGACNATTYNREEELYFVRSGKGLLNAGDESHPLVANDFTYISPTVRHTVSNPSDQPLQLVFAAVKIPAGTKIAQPPKLVVANLSELQEQVVNGHPPSVLYKLLIGPRNTARDRISAAYAVADFFIMDFAPGGTNFPHHHEVAEEIYLVLDGEGKIVAGGGMDGLEGLHPAKPGDAYYFRQNCTVGFYNQDKPGAKAHILALRAYVPLPKELD
jgi:mannose-6-phosphate isomerase-like protein (cupin superfamily)